MVTDTISPELPQPWVEPVDQKELLDAFSGCGNDVSLMLQNMKNPSRWSIHTLYPPLTSYVKGRVVLVGDSVSPAFQVLLSCPDSSALQAHGMLPHLGAGVGQGFEDVYTLCRLLAHPRTNKSSLDVSPFPLGTRS